MMECLLYIRYAILPFLMPQDAGDVLGSHTINIFPDKPCILHSSYISLDATPGRTWLFISFPFGMVHM